MKQLSSKQTMTVKEVANVIGVSDQAIRDATRKLFPDILVTGKTTYLDEEQVTAIKLQIQAGGNRYLKDNFEVVNNKTKLEKALLIKQALILQQEIIEDLTAENEQMRPKALAYDEFITCPVKPRLFRAWIQGAKNVTF